MRILIEKENVKFCNDCIFFSSDYFNEVIKVNCLMGYYKWMYCKTLDVKRPKKCIDKYGR